MLVEDLFQRVKVDHFDFRFEIGNSQPISDTILQELTEGSQRFYHCVSPIQVVQ